jgi:hypothetical protein
MEVETEAMALWALTLSPASGLSCWSRVARDAQDR